MELDPLSAKALVAIETAIEKSKAAAIMASFGKDSMVLVHLTRHLGLPIICHIPPYDRAKWRFAQDIIESWDLRVHQWPPRMVSLCERNGELEVISAYNTSGKQHFCIGQRVVESVLDERRFICGLHDVVNQPKGIIEHPWDLLICAQKDGDTDHAGGKVSAQVDLKQGDGTSVLLPFRQWSDADISEYLIRHRVPFDKQRYHWTGDIVQELESNDSHNPDVIHGCFRCVRRNQGAVQCPRIGNQVVSNCSNQVPYVEAQQTF